MHKYYIMEMYGSAFFSVKSNDFIGELCDSSQLILTLQSALLQLLTHFTLFPSSSNRKHNVSPEVSLLSFILLCAGYSQGHAFIVQFSYRTIYGTQFSQHLHVSDCALIGMSKSNGECSKTRKKLHKQATSSKNSSKETDRRIFVLPGKLMHVYKIYVYFRTFLCYPVTIDKCTSSSNAIVSLRDPHTGQLISQ